MPFQVLFKIGVQACLERFFRADIKWQVLSVGVFAKTPVTSCRTEWIHADIACVNLYDVHESVDGVYLPIVNALKIFQEAFRIVLDPWIATLYERWLDGLGFINSIQSKENTGIRTSPPVYEACPKWKVKPCRVGR